MRTSFSRNSCQRASYSCQCQFICYEVRLMQASVSWKAEYELLDSISNFWQPHSSYVSRIATTKLFTQCIYEFERVKQVVVDTPFQTSGCDSPHCSIQYTINKLYQKVLNRQMRGFCCAEKQPQPNTTSNSVYSIEPLTLTLFCQPIINTRHVVLDSYYRGVFQTLCPSCSVSKYMLLPVSWGS